MASFSDQLPFPLVDIVDVETRWAYAAYAELWTIHAMIAPEARA